MFFRDKICAPAQRVRCIHSSWLLTLPLFRRLSSAAMTFVALCFFSACAAGDEGFFPRQDASSSDTQISSQILSVKSAIFVGLEPGNTETFVFSLADQNGAVSGEVVDFALVGESHDSTLVSTTAQSDDEGEVSVEITAGFTPTTFRLRANTRWAEPVFVDVSIADVGLGVAEVALRPRAIQSVDAFELRIVVGTECGPGIEELAATDTLTLPPRSQDLRLVNLSLTENNAIVILAYDDDKRLVGYACDDLSFEQTRNQSIQVDILSTALLPERLQSEATLSFDASPGILSLSALVFDPARSEAEHIIEMVLTRAETTLSREEYDALSLMIGAKRTAIENALSSSGHGPLAATEAFLDVLADPLKDLRVVLTFDRAQNENERLTFGSLLDAQGEAVVAGQQNLTQETALRVEGEGAEIAVTSTMIEVGLVPWLQSRLSLVGSDDYSDASGCSEFAAETQSPGCDIECVQNVCEQALALEIRGALGQYTSPSQGDHLVPSGSLFLGDEDGDDVLDSIGAQDFGLSWNVNGVVVEVSDLSLAQAIQ